MKPAIAWYTVINKENYYTECRAYRIFMYTAGITKMHLLYSEKDVLGNYCLLFSEFCCSTRPRTVKKIFLSLPVLCVFHVEETSPCLIRAWMVLMCSLVFHYRTVHDNVNTATSTSELLQRNTGLSAQYEIRLLCSYSGILFCSSSKSLNEGSV